LSYNHPASQSQTPTTPHAPAHPSMNGNTSNPFPQHMSPSATGGSMPPPTNYNHPYSQSIMYPTSASTTMPPTSSSLGLPTIRPMPPGGVSGASNGLPSLTSAGQLSQLGQQPSFLQSEEQPTHVVGSQGRRGVLPSAPGRPLPPPQGTTTSTKSMIPQKDADGKFPCPHCNKTYLHAKHLKRHLLRRESLLSLAELSLDMHDTNKSSQTREIVHTCAICARTPSAEAISSNAISRNARYDGETPRAPTTSPINGATRTVGIGCP
jgi:hypothetical protein